MALVQRAVGGASINQVKIPRLTMDQYLISLLEENIERG